MPKQTKTAQQTAEEKEADALFKEIERRMPDECAELDMMMGADTWSDSSSDDDVPVDTACLQDPPRPAMFMVAMTAREPSPPIACAPGEASELIAALRKKNVNGLEEVYLVKVEDTHNHWSPCDEDDSLKCEVCSEKATHKLTIHRATARRFRVGFCSGCKGKFGVNDIAYIQYSNGLVEWGYRLGGKLYIERF